MRVFSAAYLNELSAAAKQAHRGRQHRNIHAHYDERVQRLFNAIEPTSYIRPHRHVAAEAAELLVAVRGNLAAVLFTATGAVRSVVRLSAQGAEPRSAVGVEVEVGEWHTVVAIAPGSVLLEIKAGPFDPAAPKEFAPWAPPEGSDESLLYQQHLSAFVSSWVD